MKKLLRRILFLCVSVAAIGLAQAGSFTVRLQPRSDDQGGRVPTTRKEVDRSANIVSKRLNSMGLAKAKITVWDNEGFVVETGSLTPEETKKLIDTIESPGRLSLRQVHPDSAKKGPDGRSLAARVLSRDELVPGYRAYDFTAEAEDGTEASAPILLNRREAIRSSDIASAYPSPQQADAVAISLNGDGTDKMIAFTKDMRPHVDRIAIVLDGKVISAPVINQTPLGKNFIIEGLSDPGETQNLARALMAPLEFPLKVEKEKPVPAKKAAK